MSGYADPNADPNEGAVTAQGEYGAMQPAYGGEEYDGAVANFADGKGGKGAPFMQTEKLWLFGEKKPLSIQSYGSLPVEARDSPGRAPPCPCFPPLRRGHARTPRPPATRGATAVAAQLGGRVARGPARDQQVLLPRLLFCLSAHLRVQHVHGAGHCCHPLHHPARVVQHHVRPPPPSARCHALPRRKPCGGADTLCSPPPPPAARRRPGSTA